MSVTGASRSGRRAGKIKLSLGKNGSINFRAAENGIIVSVYDGDKDYDDDGYERTLIVQDLSEIDLT